MNECIALRISLDPPAGGGFTPPILNMELLDLPIVGAILDAEPKDLNAVVAAAAICTACKKFLDPVSESHHIFSLVSSTFSKNFS